MNILLDNRAKEIKEIEDEIQLMLPWYKEGIKSKIKLQRKMLKGMKLITKNVLGRK